MDTSQPPFSAAELESLRATGNRLAGCARRVWKRFEEIDPGLVATMTPRTKASLFHDLLAEAAEVEFAGDPETNYLVSRGLRHLSTNEARIRFKKFGKELRASTASTSQSQQWVQSMLPGLGSAQVPLHFGYRTNRLWTGIDQVALVRQEGRNVTWFEEFALEQRDEPACLIPQSAFKPKIRLKQELLEERRSQVSAATLDGTHGASD